MSKNEYRAAQRAKPVGVAGIERIIRIADEGPGKVNEVGVDCLTASAVAAVWGKLSAEHRAKLASFPVVKACVICLRLCK